jgi:phage terminase large subunit-like protein
MVYATEDAFAEEVIEELAAFPFGEHDDFCDSSTMALMRIRQGGLIELDNDYADEMSFDRKALTYY